MGYYTKFDLQIKPVEKEKIPDIVEVIQKKDLFHYVFDPEYYYDDHTRTLYFDCWEEEKWYDHNEDISEISKQFSDYVFKLECNGEDGETWIVYYQNGKDEFCSGRVIYDEPEEILWPQ